MSIKLKQYTSLPTEEVMSQSNHWIMLLPEKITKPLWRRIPHGEIIKKYRKRLNQPDTFEAVTMDLPNQSHSRLSHACVKPDNTAFKLLGLARNLVEAHLKFQPKILSIVVIGFSDKQSERLAEILISAVLATTKNLPCYKHQKRKNSSLKKVHLYGCYRNDGFARSFAVAEGNTLARQLSMIPPNKLRPKDYCAKIEKLARERKWKYRFYDIDTLKEKKAGAFLAVCQGSPDTDAGIVRLGYYPHNSKQKLSLVGKGICYDTGGTNLKSAKHMFGMHEDMQGSAVALGLFLALSRLQVNFSIECWLALAMNHIGPYSYKPNDIITASDGTNIEVVHTDAEGRMILADTLVLASQERPDLIIDYATLTGACVYSLGSAYSGIFTNREPLIETLIKSGKDSGERVWPFPLDEDYDQEIKSDIADVKQCALEGDADHILAARFLQRFIKHNIPWIHVDLSSSNHKGGLAHIPTNTTGFGIRFSVDLLLNKEIMKTLE